MDIFMIEIQSGIYLATILGWNTFFTIRHKVVFSMSTWNICLNLVFLLMLEDMFLTKRKENMKLISIFVRRLNLLEKMTLTH